MESLTPGRHCRLVAWSDLYFKVTGSNPDRKIYQATAKWEAHNFETKGVNGRGGVAQVVKRLTTHPERPGFESFRGVHSFFLSESVGFLADGRARRSNDRLRLPQSQHRHNSRRPGN